MRATAMSDILLGVLSAIFIAAVSSWITVQLSLRQFRTEKWWERKADAYAKVIETLYNSKEFSDHHLEAFGNGREVPDEVDADVRAKSKAAHAEIRRIANVGAFLLSDQAMLRLNQFRNDEKSAGNTTDWYEYLESDWKAVSSCLEDFIKIAKVDLRV
jgi:hypothetical protein